MSQETIYKCDKCKSTFSKENLECLEITFVTENMEYLDSISINHLCNVCKGQLMLDIKCFVKDKLDENKHTERSIV